MLKIFSLNHFNGLFCFLPKAASLIAIKHNSMLQARLYNKLSNVSEQKDEVKFLEKKRVFLVWSSKSKTAKIDRKKRMILSYFSTRSFFWAISFFSRLHFILWKVRFVIWLNFLVFSLQAITNSFSARLPVIALGSYVNYNKIALYNFISSRNLFFNRSFLLWRFKASDWSDIEFSTGLLFFRDIITRYKRIIWAPSFRLSFIFNKVLSGIYEEKQWLVKWFAANKLPKYLRTPATDAQWAKSVERNRLVKSDLRYLEKRIKKYRSRMIFSENSLRKIF